nr:hypothetical protein [Tanacetum cinerariifolium]
MTNGIARKKEILRRKSKNKNKFNRANDYEDDKEEEREEDEKWPTFVCDVDGPKNHGISVSELEDHFNKRCLHRSGEYINLVLCSKMRNIKDVSLLLEESSVYLDALVVDDLILEFDENDAHIDCKRMLKLGLYAPWRGNLLRLQPW